MNMKISNIIPCWYETVVGKEAVDFKLNSVLLATKEMGRLKNIYEEYKVYF